jgi:chemotaxis protein MotA
MLWPDGLSGTLAVIGATIAAGAAALILARVLRVDRFLVRLSRSGILTPAEQVERLADLAEVAHRGGVLALEARAAGLNDDFLARAIARAVEGMPADEIRHAMEAEIDAATAAPGFGRAALLRLARYPQVGVIAGAGALLTVMVVYGAEPGLAGQAAIAGLGLFLVGIGAGAIMGPLADACAARHAAIVMTRLLQVEAMVLIRTGWDGRAVAHRLRSMLPSAPVSRIPAAKAA